MRECVLSRLVGLHTVQPYIHINIGFRARGAVAPRIPLSGSSGHVIVRLYVTLISCRVEMQDDPSSTRLESSEEELKAWATVRSDAIRIAGDPVDEYDRE